MAQVFQLKLVVNSWPHWSWRHSLSSKVHDSPQ